MSTPNLGLTEVPSNIMQPSVPVNESLQALDALIFLAVQDKDLNTPPTTNGGDVGKSWIVGGSPTGAWSGHAGHVALCTAATLWRFFPPKNGWRAKVLDESNYYQHNGTSWLLESSGGGSSVVGVSTPANVAGTVTLDFAGKSKYVAAITLGANVGTLAFANLPGAGKYAEYELHIAQDATGSRTFALPASHKALGGSDVAIAAAANAVTVLSASTVDNGTTWRYAMQESA